MNTSQILEWATPIISLIVAALIFVQRGRWKNELDARAKAIEANFEAKTAATKIEVDRTTADIQADLQSTKDRAKMLDFVIETRNNDIKRIQDMIRVQDDSAKVVAANNATINAFSKMVANYTASVDRNTEVTERLEVVIENLGKIVQGVLTNVTEVSGRISETGDQVVAAGKQIMTNSERIGNEIIVRLEKLETDIFAELAVIKSDLEAQAVTLKDIDERLKQLEIKPEPVPPPSVELALKPITSVTISTEETKKE